MRRFAHIIGSACAVIAIGVGTAVGQEQVSANPTRPSVSDNGYLTAAGFLEVEAGGVFLENAWSVPALLKLGASNRVEVSLAMTGIVNHSEQEGSRVGAPGAQVKGQVTSGDWGAVAAVGRIDWPRRSGPVYTVYPVLSLRSLPVAVDVTTGVLLSRNGNAAPGGTFLYAVAVSPDLGGPVGVFLEVFGLESSSSSATGIDAGISYAASPRFVLDIAANAGIGGSADDWGIQAGLTCTLGQIY